MLGDYTPTTCTKGAPAQGVLRPKYPSMIIPDRGDKTPLFEKEGGEKRDRHKK